MLTRRVVNSVLLITAVFALSALPAPAQEQIPARVEILRSIAHGVTPPLRSLPPQAAVPLLPVIPLRAPGGNGRNGGGGGGSWIDPDLKNPSATSSSSLAISRSWDGIPANGSIPPDTNLAVSPSQVVQIANTEYAVWDKLGNVLIAPTAIHGIFSALADAPAPANMCASSDGGDPIVLYDQIAGRWFITQLEYTSSFQTNLICTAVSQTADATGSYNVYAWNFGNNLPDYPKFGVWPDAYYMTANMFRNASTFVGAGACAFDRAAMVAGAASPAAQCFQGGTGVYSLLPTDLDGSTLPPGGEPNFLLMFTASRGAGNTLNLYRFHVDWSDSANSNVAGPIGIGAGSYHEACGGGACVPQAGTSQQLDTLGDRLMYRLSYRNFGSYESLAVNHSVQVSSSSKQVGIRWYEIRNPNGSPSLAQQATYSPDGTIYRWMGSIAQDKLGNMAVGYSLSSSSLNPSIYFAVRTPTDTQFGSEVRVIDGTGSQSFYSRWGDYSSMAVDPADDCTFWYTTEYLTSNGSFNWKTRIASFKFSSCQ